MKNIIFKYSNFASALLLTSLIAPLLFAVLDFSDIDYFGEIDLLSFTYFIVWTCALFLSYVAGLLVRIDLPSVSFDAHSSLYAVLFWLPLAALIIINIYALIKYEFGLSLDLQSYIEDLAKFRGKSIIHLFPVGFFIYINSNQIIKNKKRKRLSIGICVLNVFLYVILFSERAFMIPLIIIFGVQKRLLLGAFLKSRFVVILPLAVCLVFVLSEMTRAFVADRLSYGDFGTVDAIKYSLKRFAVYYADACLKSALSLSDTVAGNLTSNPSIWTTEALNNTGATRELIDSFGVGGLIIAVIFFGCCGVCVGNGLDGNYPNYMTLFSLILISAGVEFQRWSWLTTSRMWLPIIVLCAYLSLMRRSRI